MDDCMINSKKRSFDSTAKSLIGNVLKTSPKKSRVDAIQRLKPPNTSKECRKFCGLINYLSMYLKNLLERQISNCYLTEKGIPFEWTEEHQKASGDKEGYIKPTCTCNANNKGHSTFVPGSSGTPLYQEPIGKVRLDEHSSKKLPSAVIKYRLLN